MILLIDDYIQKLADAIDKNCENICRVNSEYVKVKNIPRDVIVNIKKTKRLRLRDFRQTIQRTIGESGKASENLKGIAYRNVTD